MKNTFKNLYRKSKKIVILTALILYSGCSEDFLKPDPLSFYEPAVTFTTLAGLESTLAMADLQLRTYWTWTADRDRGLPISTEHLFSELTVHGMTDNVRMLTDIENTLTPTNDITDDDGNSIRFFWDNTYEGIKYANTVISFIDNVEGLDTETRNAFLGRAYFHRSFRYLALSFQFRNVPLVSKILETPKFNYSSTRFEAILEMITLDMEKAVQWVPEQSEMEYLGMVNNGACRHLLIKCYLATGQWDKAIKQADTLIDMSEHELMTEPFGEFFSPMESTWHIERNVIWDLHRPQNKSIVENKEALLSLPNSAQTDAAIKMRSMRNWLPMWDNRNELKSPSGQNAIKYVPPSSIEYNPKYDYRTAWGRGVAHVRPTTYYTHGLWIVNGVNDESDLRHSTVVGNWVSMDSVKYTNVYDTAWYGKYIRLYDDDDNLLTSDRIRNWFDFPHYKTYIPCPEERDNPDEANHRGGAGDWYCYRLAETYLLRAEAKFYTGDIAGATEDVNTIRERAQCSELYASVNIGDIMDERARELYMEEWRHMELSRVSYCLALSGKADEWGNTYSVDNLSENSYWWQRVNTLNEFYNKGVVVWQQSNRPYTIAPRNIYWPIPQFAINANREGTLSQNPGYDGYDPNVPMWENWEDAVADEDITE